MYNDIYVYKHTHTLYIYIYIYNVRKNKEHDPVAWQVFSYKCLIFEIEQFVYKVLI